MLEISKFIVYLVCVTWLSLSLLFLISSIKLARLEPKLPLFSASWGGAKSRGGGSGGGGRLVILDLFKASMYCFSSYSAYLNFNCKFLSWFFSAWVLTCCITVYYTIIFITSLLFKSSWVSFKESKSYCHYGGISFMFVAIFPVFKSNDKSLCQDKTYPDFCYGYYVLSPKNPFSLFKKLPYSFFFLASSNLCFLICWNYSIFGELEEILTFMMSASSLLLNKKPMIPAGY